MPLLHPNRVEWLLPKQIPFRSLHLHQWPGQDQARFSRSLCDTHLQATQAWLDAEENDTKINGV